jgi:hypothetical protein
VKNIRNLFILFQISCRVTLQNSILCSRSTIGSKCEIQKSIVCLNQQAEGNSQLIISFVFEIFFFWFLGKLNGETISNESGGYMSYDDEQ